MSVKIGFFALEDHVGCTSMAIHVANHIGCGENSVGIVEPQSATDPQFDHAHVEFQEDHTFYANNVHYYPQETSEEPDEDILIYDFGKINILHEFPDDFTKLYLCTSADENNIEDIQDYILDSQTECDLIIIGASKELLSIYKEYGYRCISILDKKDTICPYNLALQINIILRQNKLVPPEYKSDWIFDPIDFSIIEEPEKKKSFFGSLFGSKKNSSMEKDNSDEQDQIQDEPETLPGNGFSGQQDKLEIQKSIPFEAASFVSVPAPKSPEEVKEEQEQKQKEELEKKKLEEQKKKEQEKEERTARLKEKADQNRLEQERKAAQREEKKLQKEENERKKAEELEKQKKLHTQKKEEQKRKKEEKAREKEENLKKKKTEKADKLSVFQKFFENRNSSKLQAKNEKRQKELERKAYEERHDEKTGCKTMTAFQEDIQKMEQFAFVSFTINDYEYIKDVVNKKQADNLLSTISKALKRHFENVYRSSECDFYVLVDHVTEKTTEKVELELIKLDNFMQKKTAASKDTIYRISYGVAYTFEAEDKNETISLANERKLQDYKDKELKQQEEHQNPESERKESVSDPDENQEKETESAQMQNKGSHRLAQLAEKVTNRKGSVKQADLKPVYIGHISVFVTSVRHSCGCSYTAGSIASAMTDLYNRNVHIKHDADIPLPDNYMVKEILTDSDMVDAIRSGLVVYDAGVYSDLTDKQKDDMIRSDLRIMVSTADDFDLKRLAKFIEEQKNSAEDWLYVFNHVQKDKEKEILEIMDGYSVLILPQHDYAKVPDELRKEWEAAINWQISSF